MIFQKSLLALLACVGLVSAQAGAAYCDATNSICYTGYTDPTLDITVGIVLPPLSTGTTPNSTEFIAEIVAPVTYGWTGVSMGGQMADSLLFVTWPNGEDVVFSPRWTSGYVQPTPYDGPIITMLPDTMVNSTHMKASFRCQNCTTWDGGSLGAGNLASTQVLAYVTSTTTPVDDPTNSASNFTEHNEFDFFGVDLSTTHSSSYDTYLGGSASSSGSATAPASTVASTFTGTATSTASGATQTKYGQCGGEGWTGPTVCAAGSTCTASSTYYSQCL